MDILDYQSLEDEELKAKIRSLSRSQLDEQINYFGGQYALSCQRLEAMYTPDRIELFASIRPGGLAEIDQAIAQAGQNPKELALLKFFRELNRILLPFMDVYEGHVLKDLTYMSKDELEALDANVSKQMADAEAMQKQNPDDYRRTQNASGTVRLTTLIKAGIQHELKERFGA